MTTHTTKLLATLTLSLALAACDRSSSPKAPGTAGPETAGAAPAALATPAVARIVFVGKQNACDCTRKAIDAGWAALQKALGTPARLPVEQVQIDTEAAKVAPLRQMRPIMALPAIYFLDGKGALVEQLQGEVTAEQVAGAMKPR